ncbi:MAG: hypothetical protein IT355_02470 [Gemmatimonadaceae bacterium]|nr:hypothetical protein [Gemmatimonadaceae bacterium]
MAISRVSGQFADELAELHDGSISLFVTLPVFRQLLQSTQGAAVLAECEAVLGEHLAHLDGIVGTVLTDTNRRDGDLTGSLFRSLTRVRRLPASPVRDEEIIGVVQQAQLFLMGSCSFALRIARQSGLDRCVYILERSLLRLRSLAVRDALPFATTSSRELSGAVA